MMRITNLADYAVVLMCQITREVSPPLSSSHLAETSGIPAPTVSKILGELTRANLLISMRGIKGGVRLAKPADEISVTEIIEAIDGPISLTSCIEEASKECDLKKLCVMRPHWQVINEAVRGALSNIYLDEVAQFPNPEAILKSFGIEDKSCTA